MNNTFATYEYYITNHGYFIIYYEYYNIIYVTREYYIQVVSKAVN